MLQREQEQERVRQLLTEAVMLLCRNSLQFEEEVSVEGLIGITLDRHDIFLVSIRETVQQAFKEIASAHKGEKRSEPEPESVTSSKRRKVIDHRRDSGGRDDRRDAARESPAADRNDRVERKPDVTPRLAGRDLPAGDPNSIKTEKGTTEDNNVDYQQEDGRKYNPAHDSSTDARQTGPTPESVRQRLDFNETLSQQQDGSSGGRGSGADAGPSLPTNQDHVQVKQELEEPEECYLIDSDSEEHSDNSHSGSMNLQPGQGVWPTQLTDGGGFNLSEIDLMAASQQFSQPGQFGDGSGGHLQFPGDISSFTGPVPSTSQDGSQRGHLVPMLGHTCPECHQVVRDKEMLNKHRREVHHKALRHCCPLCNYNSNRSHNLRRHLATRHPYMVEGIDSDLEIMADDTPGRHMADDTPGCHTVTPTTQAQL